MNGQDIPRNGHSFYLGFIVHHDDEIEEDLTLL